MAGAGRSARDLSPTEYLQRPGVGERIREFCGLTPGSDSTCVYVAAMGVRDGPHAHWGQVPILPPELLPDMLACGDDVTRSMWDTESLILFVDLDYINADDPADGILHPADTFLLMEPTYRSLCDVLDELGMPLLDLITGAGYAFVGRVSLRGAAAERLRACSPGAPPWFRTHARRRPEWTSHAIDEDQARAYHGLGYVLEYLAHQVLRRAASASEIPVVVENTVVGAGGIGRSCVSLDLTHMGDPLDSRHLRVAFGLYQKHRLRPDLVGPIASARVPALAVIPRERRALLEALGSRSLSRAAMLAPASTAAIPDVEQGVKRLLDEYEGSALARWHRALRDTPQPPAGEPAVRALDVSTLPPCVAACLEHPNDLLLKPEYVQLLTRTLFARGWEVSEIAALVGSIYARDDLWGGHWARGDPSSRAEFDVRVFAGLVAMGLDEGVDLNCVSTREKGMCPPGTCGMDLTSERERLLGRRES